jgi:hypothetical protein
MIKDFRALLDNTPDATNRVALYSHMEEFINYKGPNMVYIWDEQLDAMERYIYHVMKHQVEGLNGECISRMY